MWSRLEHTIGRDLEQGAISTLGPFFFGRVFCDTGRRRPRALSDWCVWLAEKGAHSNEHIYFLSIMICSKRPWFLACSSAATRRRATSSGQKADSLGDLHVRLHFSQGGGRWAREVRAWMAADVRLRVSSQGQQC